MSYFFPRPKYLFLCSLHMYMIPYVNLYIWYHTVQTQNRLSPCGSLIRLLYVDSDECVFFVLGPLLLVILVMLVALTFTLLVCAHIEIQSNIVVVFLQSDWLCIGIAPWYSLYSSHLFIPYYDISLQAVLLFSYCPFLYCTSSSTYGTIPFHTISTVNWCVFT